MSIGPVSMPVVPQITGVSAAQSPAAATGATGATGAGATDFGSELSNGLDSLQALQNNADALAVQAATGTLTNVHDYMIAATQASVATDLTVAVRNKAVDAFNEIMRMPV